MYVFKTWLIANLFHPFVLIVFFGKDLNEQQGIEFLGIYFFGFIISFIFSLPVLAIAYLIYRIIKRTNMDVIHAFIVWLISATIIPFLLLFVLSMMFFDTESLFNDIEMIFPAMISAFLAISIRLNYFIRDYLKEPVVITDYTELN